MRNMFDVLDELRWLQEEEYDGEPVDREWMEEIQAELDDVVSSLVAILKEAKSDLETLRRARAELLTKEHRVKKRVDELKSMILHGLQTANRKRAGSPMHSASVSDSTPRVEVVDELQIPDEFWVVNRTLQKSVVAESFGRGFDVPGVELVRGQHVRIK